MNLKKVLQMLKNKKPEPGADLFDILLARKIMQRSEKKKGKNENNGKN